MSKIGASIVQVCVKNVWNHFNIDCRNYCKFKIKIIFIQILFIYQEIWTKTHFLHTFEHKAYGCPLKHWVWNLNLYFTLESFKYGSRNQIWICWKSLRTVVYQIKICYTELFESFSAQDCANFGHFSMI